MLLCASSLVIAAYATVRFIPQDSRALPAAFLRSRPFFVAFKTFTGSSLLAFADSILYAVGRETDGEDRTLPLFTGYIDQRSVIFQ
jgi:hypothetical protein